MTYTQRIDRSNPALIILLVDQSDSMDESIGPVGTAKSVVVAEQLNSLIYELVLRSVKTPREPPRPYFFVEALGYSTDADGECEVLPLLPGGPGAWSTTQLAENPLRIARVPDVSTGSSISAPVWIEPRATGGTPMCRALDLAGRAAAAWIANHPSAFPPLLINLTDGEATDGDPDIWARRLRSLTSHDGALLLFNVALTSAASSPQLFPSTADELPDAFSRQLFAMSSVLPPAMVESARSQGIPTRPGARGLAYNADIKTLAAFMNVGTSIGRM